ncbi:MAG TPA: hypothetical protein VN764_06315, partial [Polyangiaceae bacterium]|nr:hypothetical protein [Polyangiaceae bacterium]
MLEVRRSIIKRRTPKNGVEHPKFSNTWFAQVTENWDQLLAQLKPTKILEIGSWEGASACYLIEKLGPTSNLELHCVDTWAGGIEHDEDMKLVEQRFVQNTELAMAKVPGKVSLI